MISNKKNPSFFHGTELSWNKWTLTPVLYPLALKECKQAKSRSMPGFEEMHICIDDKLKKILYKFIK